MTASTTKPEVFQLFQDPANLRTAYDVGDWLRDFEVHVFDTFWSGVRDQLAQRVAELADDQWRVTMSASIFEHESHLSIVPRHAADENLKRWVCVTAESLGGNPDRCYFGINGDRGRDQSLTARLAQEGCRSNRYWIGWRYFSAMGLPEFRRNPDNVLRLSEDNQREARPLVATIVKHLGDLFAKYREDLERLNTAIG